MIKPIKVIIVDYGNVLAGLGSNSEPHIEQLAKSAGISVTELKQRIYGDHNERWNRVKCGVISEEDYRTEVGKDLTTVTGDWIIDHHFDVVQLHSEFLDYLRALKEQGYHLAILSNAIPYFSDSWVKLGFMDWFDLTINSSHVGLAKPDPKVFALVTDHFNVRPDECVFVDDQQKNIDGAVKIGFHSVLYVEAVRVIEEMNRLLEIVSEEQ
jgi:epoxide hydrolase-like predicted phosphatase